MELCIVAPGITGLPSDGSVDLSEGISRVVLLTDPLHQVQLRSVFPGGTSFITDDDFINDRLQEELVKTALHLAWNWFHQGDFSRDFTYRDIDLRVLFTQDAAIYLVKAVKIAALYAAILARYEITRITVIDDSSEWVAFARTLAQSRGISFESFTQDQNRFASRKRSLADIVKSVLSCLNQYLSPRVTPGNVLYSSALRFARPFLEKKEGGYYLRDTFSAEAWKMARGSVFSHVIPNHFTPRQGPNLPPGAIEKGLSALDDYFGKQAFFCVDGQNLWPMIREDFIGMARSNMLAGARLMDQFREMFQRFKPRAVLVDEEVCFFNKTLVQVANALGVPTLCLEHGVPLISMGSVPSSAAQILAWGQPSKERLCAWGVPEAKVRITGAPQLKLAVPADFAFCRSRIEKELKITAVDKYLLLVAFPFDTNKNPTFYKTSFGAAVQESALSVAFKLLEKHLAMHLVVKFHPADENIDFSSAMVTKTPAALQERVHLVTRFDASRLIAGAYAVLSTASTMYFESLLQEKPTFLLDFRENWMGEFMSDRCLDLGDPGECAASIMRSLDPANVGEHILRQKDEIARHFYLGNTEAVPRVWEILSKRQGAAAS